MTSEDPLDGADIGETREVTVEQTHHGINFAPGEFVGRDREGHHDITRVEIIDPEFEGDYSDIRVVWKGELTKTLPPNWDHHTDPGTDTETRRSRRDKWATRVVKTVSTVVVFAVVGGIATAVTNEMAQGMTVNGEQLPMVGFSEVLPVLFIGVIIWAILWSGVLPGRVGGGGR